MFNIFNLSRIIYILSNLLVIPAIIIPNIDFLANISFLIAFFLLVKTNWFLLLIVFGLFIMKNNSNYRFNLLVKKKGEEISKSDKECVYLYAWCTLLRYFLIGISINQIFIILK